MNRSKAESLLGLTESFFHNYLRLDELSSQ